MDREALTRQIKDASDIVDVVGAFVSLQPAGGKYKGLCPFHNDHRPSFVVDPQWQNYRCWACGKFGDVFSFVQEKERVDFLEARELLARRAGISLEKAPDSPQNLGRALMLDVMKWAEEQYQKCYHAAPVADAARRYVAERQLNADSVQRFGVGFAPAAGDWLVRLATQARVDLDVLDKVGLIAQSDRGSGWYDRFRDRLMFPIRNTRGQTVGFGGRILPSSPAKDKAPKYYNSADTPLFSKSDQLFGLDLARSAGAAAGYLAVVEGYTDVMMAHQHGVCQVVATMGTALNARHVQQLRRFVPRVVLVFDADAGGKGGVDRALELFVSQEMDLSIATLPEGLDPCDLLTQHGAEPFLLALGSAVDALDFKLNQLTHSGALDGLESRRRAVDQLLNVIVGVPWRTDQTGQIKRELVVNRIAHRLGLTEQTLWGRLEELRSRKPAEAPPRPGEEAPKREAPAPPHEKELLQVLLAEPELVAAAVGVIQPGQLQHPGVRRLVEGMFALQEEGQTPDIEALRYRIDHPALIGYAFRARDIGLTVVDRTAWLERLLLEFRKRQGGQRKQELHNQLHAVSDDATALALLRQLQDHGEPSH